MRFSREQVIEKALEMGADFVIQPNSEKSVSTKDYRAAMQALNPIKRTQTIKPAPLSEARIREMRRNQW